MTTITHRQRSNRDFPRVVLSIPGLRLVGFNVLGIKNWFAVTKVYPVQNEDKTPYSLWIEKKLESAPIVLKDSARLMEIEDCRIEHVL